MNSSFIILRRITYTTRIPTRLPAARTFCSSIVNPRAPITRPKRILYQRPSTSQIQTRKMSSATSFYDFKPLDSTSSHLNIFIQLQLPRHSTTTTSHTANLRPQLIPLQKKAPPSPSPPTPAKSSSSSIRPPSAVSRLNSKDSRSSTRTYRPRTQTTSSSSASLATNSPDKNPAMMRQSKSSAN